MSASVVSSTRSGLLGRLVGRVDTGQPFELAAARTRVQAFGVALFAFGQRRGDMHLDEGQLGGVVEGAGGLAVRLQRRHQRRQRDHAGVGQQPGQMADPPDVFGAVTGGEAQVVGQAVT